ncbi:hypothetical protein RQP46_003751 [Phenoliferia psychrophenolica]
MSNPPPVNINFAALSDSDIEFMELATGPPADLLLAQCGLSARTTDTPVLVLDNAAGAGIVTKRLHELGINVNGLQVICGDLAPGMVEILRRRIQEKGWDAEAKVIDVLDIPYTSDTFDFILTNFQLQFLPDPALAMKEIGYTDIKIELLEFEVTFAGVKAWMDFTQRTMGAMLVDGVGEKLDSWMKEKYGDGVFSCPGWQALAVTGTAVKL